MSPLLAACHASPSLAIRLLDRRLQPHLEQLKHLSIDDPASNRLHQLLMRYRLEIRLQIRVDNIRLATAKQLVDLLNRILGPTLRSKAISLGFEISLENRFDHKLGRGLNYPVPDRRNAERSKTAPRLVDQNPSHR